MSHTSTKRAPSDQAQQRFVDLAAAGVLTISELADTARASKQLQRLHLSTVLKALPDSSSDRVAQVMWMLQLPPHTRLSALTGTQLRQLTDVWGDPDRRVCPHTGWPFWGG